MDDCKPVGTPVSPGSHLVKATDDEDAVEQQLSQSLVGSYTSLFVQDQISPTLNFTAFVVQADSDVMDEQMQYRMTGGDLLSYDANTTITIIITLVLKRREIGTSRRTSWLVVDSRASQLDSSQTSLEVPEGDCQRWHCLHKV